MTTIPPRIDGLATHPVQQVEDAKDALLGMVWQFRSCHRLKEILPWEQTFNDALDALCDLLAEPVIANAWHEHRCAGKDGAK